MRSHSLLSQIADEMMTPEFAARLTAAKIECAELEAVGRTVPLDTISDRLGLPPAVCEVVLAWNVANTNCREIMKAMAADQAARAMGAMH